MLGKEPEEYPFAVYATKHGALARFTEDGFVLLRAPHPHLGDGPKIGDPIPDDWGIAPANDLATEEDGFPVPVSALGELNRVIDAIL